MVASKSSIKQILVALDGSPSSMSALENSIELAIRLNAELVGLFVEDINLLRATQLPFTREISFFSSGFRRLEAADLERQLRVQADRVRRIMEQVIGSKKMSATFRIARGTIAEEILNAGKDADLLVLGKTGRSRPGFHKSGSTVRNVVIQRQGLTLVWHAISAGPRPVVLTYDGSQSAGKALDVAVSLLKQQHNSLIVYLLAESREQGLTLRLDVSDKLKETGISATFRILVRPSMQSLLWLLKTDNAGPVVFTCNSIQVSGEHLCSLVDEITNPVLLVR